MLPGAAASAHILIAWSSTMYNQNATTTPVPAASDGRAIATACRTRLGMQPASATACGALRPAFRARHLRHDPAFATVLARLIRPGSRAARSGLRAGLPGQPAAGGGRQALRTHRTGRRTGRRPRRVAAHGLELMPRDVERAQAALAGHELRARVDQGDAAAGAADVVVLLDVLHYLPHAGQE